MQQSSRGSVAIALPTFLLAGVGLALALMMYVPFAYAEEVTTTSASSTVTVAPEKLEKELKKFADKESNLRDARAVAVKMKMVERRIAELKKHIERYEGLLKRLKAVEGTSSTTRPVLDKRMEMKDKMKEKASSTRPVQKKSEQVLGVSVAQTSVSLPSNNPQLTPPPSTAGYKPGVGSGSGSSEAAKVPVVPVVPVCRLSFERGWYTFGSNMKLSWKTSGTQFVQFVIVPEAELKDALVLPSEPQVANGSVMIPASILGVPSVALVAVSETGHTSICTRSVTVLAADTSVTDKRVVPFLNQLKQLGIAEQRIIDQQKKLEQSLNSVRIKMLQLQLQIGRINGTIESDDEDDEQDEEEATSTEASVRVSAETHTGELRPAGMVGMFSVVFTVAAAGDDVYLPKTTAYTMANTKVGVNYRIDGASSTMPARGAVATLTSTADEDVGYYVVEEGTQETFTLSVAYDPTTTGSYLLQGLQINWNSVAQAPNRSTKLLPYNQFKTNRLTINGS